MSPFLARALGEVDPCRSGSSAAVAGRRRRRPDRGTRRCARSGTRTYAHHPRARCCSDASSSRRSRHEIARSMSSDRIFSSSSGVVAAAGSACMSPRQHRVDQVAPERILRSPRQIDRAEDPPRRPGPIRSAVGEKTGLPRVPRTEVDSTDCWSAPSAANGFASTSKWLQRCSCQIGRTGSSISELEQHVFDGDLVVAGARHTGPPRASSARVQKPG